MIIKGEASLRLKKMELDQLEDLMRRQGHTHFHFRCEGHEFQEIPNVDGPIPKLICKHCGEERE